MKIMIGFTFDTKFKKEGKQGITGLIKIGNYNVVYKTSRHLNFQMNHEYIVMNALNDLHTFCPFFCRSYKLITHLVDPNYKKKDNPFEITVSKPLKQETLLMEYLPFKSLYEVIKDTNISDKALLGIIKQVLLAIRIAQKEKKFTHYDLHSCNILLKPVDPDTVFLFIIDDKNQIAIPSYGFQPILIDFGFSYIQEMNNNPLFTSLAHTEVGFMTSLHDPISDLKLFLITVSNELKLFRSSKLVFTLRNISRNIFKSLNINLESGWDDPESDKETGAADVVSKQLENIRHESHIFNKYNHYCIDQLQSLITLPLRPNKTNNIKIAYKMLTTEIAKIETLIGNSFTNLYVLKQILVVARELQAKYYNKNTRPKSIIEFKQQTQEILSTVADFCNPPINYEKLFCSLLVFANCMKGILYTYIKSQMHTKLKEYSELQISSSEHIIGVIEANIPETYEFIPKTKVVVLDCIKKSSNILSLNTDQLAEINTLHSFFQGGFLYEVYNL